jgi:REP element-mobilizing transposase RayT
MPTSADSHQVLKGGNRRSVRLKEFDYGSSGAYFVTVCTRGRRPILGRIAGEVVLPSRAGEIVAEEWARTGVIRTEITAADFVAMPDHIHGII